MPRKKKPRGRPIQRKMPSQIPDTPKSVLRALLRTRPKAPREMLKQQGDAAARDAAAKVDISVEE